MTLTAAPDTRPAPVEPTTPIRPSEAIRLGCLTTAPWKGVPFGPHGQTCAIGAALIGWFGSQEVVERCYGYGYMEFEDRAGNVWLPCPKCRGKSRPLTETVYHLNDRHKWTREAIADWLESCGL